MFYTIYSITNLINGMVYIGKHKTMKIYDEYYGSGKYLKRSIDKNGIDIFYKRVLHVFDNENHMNVKEAELVNEDFIQSPKTYNICLGGQGGFSHINNNVEFRVAKNRKARRIANENGALEKANQRHKIARKQYKFNPTCCKQCQKPLDFLKRTGTFCGRSCSASYNNAKRKFAAIV